MKILTYAASLNDDAPDRYRCCARILLSSGSLHPVVFHAPTKTEARDDAQAWWDEQVAKEQSRAAANEQRAERMRQAREAKRQPETAESAA